MVIDEEDRKSLHQIGEKRSYDIGAGFEVTLEVARCRGGRAGLGLYGELYKSIGIYEDIKRLFPAPGSANGYEAHWPIYPVVLTIIFLAIVTAGLTLNGCMMALMHESNGRSIHAEESTGNPTSIGEERQDHNKSYSPQQK